MEGEFAWILSIRSSFSDFSRDVAMATNFVAKLWQNYLPPALIGLSFRNGMGYRLASTRINSYTNCSTSREKMVKIGSVVFELFFNYFEWSTYEQRVLRNY